MPLKPYSKGAKSSLFDFFRAADVLFNLLQIYMAYINTLLVQKILSEKEWLNKMKLEDFRGLTPLFYGHVNPYERLLLNMLERIIIK